MSGLRPPSLGPLLGHTTATSCRLWIRAEDSGDHGAVKARDRRTIGMISLLKDNGKPDPNRTYYFRLWREYDRTGSFTLGETKSFEQEKDRPLEPNKAYRVRMAMLSLDDSFDEDEE